MSAFDRLTRQGFCLCCGDKPVGPAGTQAVCSLCEKTCRRGNDTRCLHAPRLPDPRPRRND